MSETKILNVYEKLSKITAELSTVAKNLEVGFGASKYKAVGEADVLRAVKPLENKYGIYSYPYHREIIDTGTSTTKSGTVNVTMRIEVIYRFVNIEKPDEFIDITSYGDGIDSQDKACGKAMTYADKYALLKAYKIITGEDPDQYASEEQESIKPVAKAKQTRPSNMPTYNPSLDQHLPLTDDQKVYVEQLEPQWKELACKKFGVGTIWELSQDQVNYIRASFEAKRK